MAGKEDMSSKKEGTPSLQLGDMVAFERKPGYEHVGIYVGDEKVVHFSKDLNTGTKSEIQIEPLEKVAAGGTYKISNQDHMKTPLQPEEIVKRAYARIGERKMWGPFHNCETVASEIRYGDGKGHSEQALKAGDWLNDFTHKALNPGGF